MSILEALIMGLVQGLTEFLPVSSSAHLVFADHFLHLHLSEADTVSFDVLLHVGTLLAVLIYFRKDVLGLLRGAGQLLRHPQVAWRKNPFSRLAVMLILGTIPAAILGVTLKPFFEEAFQNVFGTATLLLLTAAMLIWITRRRTGDRSLNSAGWKDALLIGGFQALAILPGISRSGATITGGLLRGFDRDAAPRFSFLLSIPIIFAGGLFDLLDTLETGINLPLSALAVGFVASAVSGYLAVVLLLDIVRKGRLDRFAYYCLAVGLGMILYWAYLVPQPDMNRIAGLVKGRPVAINAEGELGPIELGQPLTIQLPVRARVVPVREVYALISDGHSKQRLAMHPQPLAPATGMTTFVSDIFHVHPNRPVAAGGEVHDLWVVFRNEWGIQNEVRLRVRIMPESPARRLAYLPR